MRDNPLDRLGSWCQNSPSSPRYIGELHTRSDCADYPGDSQQCMGIIVQLHLGRNTVVESRFIVDPPAQHNAKRCEASTARSDCADCPGDSQQWRLCGPREAIAWTPPKGPRGTSGGRPVVGAVSNGGAKRLRVTVALSALSLALLLLVILFPAQASAHTGVMNQARTITGE